MAGGTFISDGGNDMYDDGNCISVPGTSSQTASCSSISSTLKVVYKANCASSTVNGESYKMAIDNDGISVLYFDQYTKDTISINGNNGADGGGSRGDGSYSVNGWTGYYKVTWGQNNDPGINHLWVTNAPSSSVTHTFATSTDRDWDWLQGVKGYRVIYLMWGTAVGTRTSDSQMNNLVTAISNVF